MEYDVERVIEIWPNDKGWHLEVGKDRDCLGLVEIRLHDDEKKDIPARIVLDRAGAVTLANMIIEFCNQNDNFKGV